MGTSAILGSTCIARTVLIGIDAMKTVSYETMDWRRPVYRGSKRFSTDEEWGPVVVFEPVLVPVCVPVCAPVWVPEWVPVE